MNYKLKRKRYLALVGEIPVSREFLEGTVFEKQGIDNGIVFLIHDGVLVCVNEKAFRGDFEMIWNNTRLFGGADGTETD